MHEWFRSNSRQVLVVVLSGTSTAKSFTIKTWLLIILYLDFVRILENGAVYRVFNQMTFTTRNTENQVVQGRTAKDIDMVA